LNAGESGPAREEFSIARVGGGLYRGGSQGPIPQPGMKFRIGLKAIREASAGYSGGGEKQIGRGGRRMVIEQNDRMNPWRAAERGSRNAEAEMSRWRRSDQMTGSKRIYGGREVSR